MTIANKKNNILNGIESQLTSKIYAKKLMEECKDFIENLKKDYPDLEEYIDSISFKVKVTAFPTMKE